jgi:hypothetical protein
MQTQTRNGKRWSVNELLRLQREYELLEWSVQEIAESHQRTVTAILYKIEQEGFISSWSDARGFDISQFQETGSSSSAEDIYFIDDLDDTADFCDDEKDEDYVDDGDDEDDDDFDDEDDVEVIKLSERVWSLETSVQDIGNMVKQLFDTMVEKKTKSKAKTRPSLRTYSR